MERYRITMELVHIEHRELIVEADDEKCARDIAYSVVSSANEPEITECVLRRANRRKGANEGAIALSADARPGER